MNDCKYLVGLDNGQEGFIAAIFCLLGAAFGYAAQVQADTDDEYENCGRKGENPNVLTVVDPT